MLRSVGIYPGTFDPVHQGHVAFALQAMRALNLDEIVFLPEPKPRRKTQVTDISHRTALIGTLAEKIEGLSVMSLEAEQFTVKQTLPEIRSRLGDAKLTLLIGSDVAAFLQGWDGIDVLLKEVGLAIGMRLGANPQDIAASMTAVAQATGVAVRYELISAPGADITSSHIRRGKAEASHLHPLVAGYIKEYRLYTTSPTED